MTSTEIAVDDLDQAYASIMSSVINTAEAPHFTDLARTFDWDLEHARLVMHELCANTPGWMHPGTDWLASFPPFNVQPTQYRISIGERHGWFGQ